MKSISFSGLLKTDIISKTFNDATESLFKSSKGTISDLSALDLKIESVLKLIQAICLQSTVNHTGILVTFTSTINPFPLNAGIAFAWFRISPKDSTLIRIEDYFKSFYLPTIDDIGYKICVQCEDEYDQGLSRYLEVNNVLFISFILIMI